MNSSRPRNSACCTMCSAVAASSITTTIAASSAAACRREAPQGLPPCRWHLLLKRIKRGRRLRSIGLATPFAAARSTVQHSRFIVHCAGPRGKPWAGAGGRSDGGYLGGRGGRGCTAGHHQQPSTWDQSALQDYARSGQPSDGENRGAGGQCATRAAGGQTTVSGCRLQPSQGCATA